ncbi:MAG: sensor histidine kinase [Clostridia bacterium]|nr:sensor histidine kinase [Clostridia bacterium]
MPASTLRATIVLSIILLLSFAYRNVWYKNLLLGILIFGIPALIELMVGMSFLVFGIDVSRVYQSVYLVIGTLISKLLTFTAAQFIKAGRHSFGNISVWYYITFTLLSLSSSLVAVIMLDYIRLSPRLYMQVTAILSVWLLAAGNVLIFYVIDRINTLHIAERELRVTQKLLDEQKLHYEDVIKEQNNVAKISHDIKNSLIGVAAELNNGNTSQARDYIDRMLDSISSRNTEILCEDISLNTILTIKKAEASKNGIDFICSDNINTPILIDAIDLCVIMGNILDNAIDACNAVTDRKPEILVFMYSKGKNLIISVKNSVAERVDTKLLTTNKPNKRYHGFGIARIKELVERYNGNLDMRCDDEFFETNFVIINE